MLFLYLIILVFLTIIMIFWCSEMFHVPGFIDGRFPALRVNYFEFWLAYFIVYVLCDWLELSLLFLFFASITFGFGSTTVNRKRLYFLLI